MASMREIYMQKRRRQASEDVDTPAAKKSTTDASLAADKATLRREECRQDIRALYMGYMSLMESGDDAEAAKFFHGLLETIGANRPLHRRRLAARLISRTLWRFPVCAEQAFHVLAALYDCGRPDDQDLPKPTSTSASCPGAPSALAQLEVDTRRDALYGMSNVLDAAIVARQEATLMHLVVFLMRIVHRQGIAGASSKGRPVHAADANGRAHAGASPCSCQTSPNQQPPHPQQSRSPSEPLLPRKRPWDHGGRRINGMTSAPQQSAPSSGTSAGSPPDPALAGRCGHATDKSAAAAGGSNNNGNGTILAAQAVHAAATSDGGFASTLLAHAFSVAPRAVLTVCLRAISATARGRPSNGSAAHLQNQQNHLPLREGEQDDTARDCEAASMLLGLLLWREATHPEQRVVAKDDIVGAAASRNAGDVMGKRTGNGAGAHSDAVPAVTVLPDAEEEQAGWVAPDGYSYGCGGTNEGGSGSLTTTTSAGSCLAESVLQVEPDVQPWLADVIPRLLSTPSLTVTPQLLTHLRTLLHICQAATAPRAGAAAAANSADAAAVGPSGEPHLALPAAVSGAAQMAVGSGSGGETGTTASGAQPPSAAAASSLMGSDDRSVPMDLDQSISTAAIRHNEAGGGGVGGGSMAVAAASTGPADTAATPAPPPSQPPLLSLPPGGVPGGLRGGPVCQAEPCLRITGMPPGTPYGVLLAELTPMGGIESVHAVGCGLGGGLSSAGRMLGQGAAATTTSAAAGLGEEVLIVFSSWEGAARCYQALAGSCHFGGNRPLQVEFCKALPHDSPAAGCHAPGGSDVVWVSAPVTHATRMAIIEALMAAALPGVEKMAQVDARAPGWLLKMASPSVVPQVVACLMRHLGPAQPLPPPPLQGLATAASGGFGSSSIAATTPVTPGGPATVTASYGAPTFTPSHHVGSHAGSKVAPAGLYGGATHISIQQHPDPSPVAIALSPACPPATVATPITQLPPSHLPGSTGAGHQALTPQDLAAASVAEAAAAVAARGGPRSGADRWAPVVIPPVPQPTQPSTAASSAAASMQHVQSLVGHMTLPTTMNPAVAAAVRHAPLLLPQPGMGGLASHAVAVGGSLAGGSNGGNGVAMHMQTAATGKLSPPHQPAAFPPGRQPQPTSLGCATQPSGHTPPAQVHNPHSVGYPLSARQPYQQPHPHTHAHPHTQDPTQAHGGPGHPLRTPLTPQSSLLQSQHQHQQHQTGQPSGPSAAPGPNLYGPSGSHPLQHLSINAQHQHQPDHSQSAQPQAGQQQQGAAHPRLQHGYSGDWQSARLPPPPPLGLGANQLPPPPPPVHEGLTAHSLPPPPPQSQQQQPAQQRPPGALHAASTLTQHGQPGLSQPQPHLYSHPHQHPQQQQQQMSPQVAQQQTPQHASSQRHQPSQQQHPQQQHYLHQPAGPSPQRQQQQSMYQSQHLQQQQLSQQVAAAAPPVLTWQGGLAKSGQHMCTLQCMTGGASAGNGATPGEREPVSWPAVLDVKLRADLAYVITLFAQTASNVRAMRRLVPAGGPEQRSKLCEFLGYLGDKNRAGVIKLDAAGALPPRTLYLVPPSAKACAELGAEWTPTEPFLLALVVPMTAAGVGRG